MTSLLLLAIVGCDPGRTVNDGSPGVRLQRFSGQGWGDSTAVATDPSGNVTTTGNFVGRVDFGGGPLTTGRRDVFLASYDPTGAHRWSTHLGGDLTANSYGITADPSGNLTVTGYFWGRVDFGGGPLTSRKSQDIFVASYSATGAHRWSKSFGGSGLNWGFGVAADRSGNVIVTGFFDSAGAVDFGGGPLPQTPNQVRTFLASYSPTGVHRWSKDLGAGSGVGVAADGSGNVIVTGYFSKTADFGGGPHTSAGSHDVFVASYDPDGAHRWSRHFGGPGQDYGQAVTVDGSGNVTVTGSFSETADFGGGPLTSAGDKDIFVASYDSAGAHRWSVRLGGPGEDRGRGIAADGSGNLTVTGSFSAAADFGGDPLTSVGDKDIFVANYGPTGAHRWSRSFGGLSVDEGMGVSVDRGGSPSVAVSCSGDPGAGIGYDTFLLRVSR